MDWRRAQVGTEILRKVVGNYLSIPVRNYKKWRLGCSIHQPANHLKPARARDFNANANAALNVAIWEIRTLALHIQRVMYMISEKVKRETCQCCRIKEAAHRVFNPRAIRNGEIRRKALTFQRIPRYLSWWPIRPARDSVSILSIWLKLHWIMTLTWRNKLQDWPQG